MRPAIPIRKSLLALHFCAASSCLVSAPAAALECTAEKAEYKLAGEPGVTAGFIPARHFASVASDLYFRVTTPQRSYWFTIETALGYGGLSLGAVGDPYVPDGGDPDNGPVILGVPSDFEGAMGFHPLTPELEVLADAPSAGKPAPPFIFAPDLGLVLWYAPASVSLDKAAVRDPMPRAVFKLTGCRDAAPPPALP